MKKAIYTFFAAAVLATALTSCIDEVFPMNASATAEQIGASASALEASVNGIPSQMAQGYLIYGNQTYEYDMGYPAIMISLAEATGDLYPLDTPGYDHYQNWGRQSSMGSAAAPTYVIWRTLYMFIKSANDIISVVDLDSDSTSDTMKGYAGIAYTARAFDYYYLMTLYQAVDSRYTQITDYLKTLTVPIVLPTTAGEEASNNPRATYEEMRDFILSDLDIAEECFANYTPSSRLFPGLAAVYAIKARVYMWDEDWANAATYARKAIEIGGSPMTEDQWLNSTTAFNTATSGWIWYIHYDAENMGNLCNFMGWVSPESDWGYASLTGPGIDKALYDSISETDFRKHAFVDPGKYDYYPYESVVTDWDFIAECPDYISLKFRCVGGDWQNYTVGGICDVPVIRVEEMYFIEAEALGRQSVSNGVNALNSFMQTYRDPQYSFSASSADDLALEIYQQMRVEFWGEGIGFQTAKRIRPGVMKNYTDTNCPTDALKINSAEIQANWNLCVPDLETTPNNGIDRLADNNPDPTYCITGPSTENEYAPTLY
ncbi:MAG: RagB/SusD family nutrient uptake outer membrane protein [Bacteroidales bacterium]|nr:RagB/SusD family nutrient uptake outer membrane protein [Bacteroidales bacterium]